jgi:hypothetical protein
MTRHEASPVQIATLPLRPAQHLAPVDGGIVITHSLGHICRGKVQLKRIYVAPRSPDMASLPPAVVSPRTGPIQKHP